MTVISNENRISSMLVDAVIAEENIHSLTLSEQKSLSETMCREAMEFHLANCPRYSGYVANQSANFSFQIDDPSTYPPIPVSAFKGLPPISVPASAIDKCFTSSGTSGVLSHVPRTRTTIERLMGSVRFGLGLLKDWHEDEVDVIHLGLPHEKADGVWFTYVMGLAELLYPTVNMAENDKIDFHAVTEEINYSLDSGKDVVLIGAPFSMLELANFVSLVPERPEGSKIWVVTGGGWKLKSGMMLAPAEFRKQLSNQFKIPQSNIRDAFNQVELNTAFFECKAHRKHVPPWVWATARDPATLLPVSDGTPGLLSYVDASIDAFPGIIIADDVGIVRSDNCDCGLQGTTVEFVRRVENGTERGCALKLEGHLGTNS